VPSKTEPLAGAALAAHEARRDLAAQLLESFREMEAGRVRVVSSPVVEAFVSSVDEFDSLYRALAG
jgi:putative transcriptional regulator